MGEGARRRRDPEARRREIVTAAAELIVEVGAEAVTHRMVAARADVPLGATTQYFDTLDDQPLWRLPGRDGLNLQAEFHRRQAVLDFRARWPARPSRTGPAPRSDDVGATSTPGRTGARRNPRTSSGEI